jgi:organic radical activating enzyme
MTEGWVAEIFRSFQGEGPYVGVPQVFLRMGGCSRRCSYCDTVWARERQASCALKAIGPEASFPNPIAPSRVLPLVVQAVETLPRVHSLSVTGGEPLEQADFLVEFLGAFRSTGCPVYLETNGLGREAARAVAPLVDIVSLDIKLPSTSGGGDLFAVYRDVLPLFRHAHLFCKIVIAQGFEMSELTEAARLVGGFDRSTLVVIQPATARATSGRVRPETIFECHREAARFLDDVRVIPQCHVLLGIH